MNISSQICNQLLDTWKKISNKSYAFGNFSTNFYENLCETKNTTKPGIFPKKFNIAACFPHSIRIQEISYFLSAILEIAACASGFVTFGTTETALSSPVAHKMKSLSFPFFMNPSSLTFQVQGWTMDKIRIPCLATERVIVLTMGQFALWFAVLLLAGKARGDCCSCSPQTLVNLFFCCLFRSRFVFLDWNAELLIPIFLFNFQVRSQPLLPQLAIDDILSEKCGVPTSCCCGNGQECFEPESLSNNPVISSDACLCGRKSICDRPGLFSGCFRLPFLSASFNLG